MFVTFRDNDSASKGMFALNGLPIAGQTLKVDFAKEQGYLLPLFFRVSSHTEKGCP